MFLIRQPAYQKIPALEIFKQIVNGEELHSVNTSYSTTGGSGSNGTGTHNAASGLVISHSHVACAIMFCLISLYSKV